jgi:broad specificity phosphatase PhoE
MPDSEIELTEKGQQQATAAGEKLRSMIGNESIYVYLSPYARSRQTWENIKKAFSPLQILTERQDPRLRELEFGNIGNIQNLSKEVEEAKRTARFYFRFNGGESGADVYDRASLFLDTLFREMDNSHHDPTENILVVSHGFFIRLFLMRYFRWTIEEIKNFKKLDNCAIITLTKVNGVYTLDETIKPPTELS